MPDRRAPDSLATPRLLLRQLRESDLDAYAAIHADPEVMRFLGGKTFTREDSWRHMATLLGHWQLRGYGMWAAEETESGRLVGRIGFVNHEGWPGFELGWVLGREFWGKGYASEAARAALPVAFGVLDRERVISLIDPENAASIRVAERLGERPGEMTDLLGKQVRIYAIDRAGFASAP